MIHKMKKLYIYTLAAAAMIATGCSKEDPFTGSTNETEGQILKSAIAVDMKVDETVRQNIRTRADVSLDDFTVIFTKPGSETPVKKYKYSEMPDVVTLPTGDYTCTATYGENRIAEWESPYFLGVSDTFTVNPYEITSYVAPIECRLNNIKVTIEFDPVLKSRMSQDSYVEVKVGANSGLNFTLAESEAGKAGYFMHTAESTLVATFNGKIDGVNAVETKSMKNVAKGNHYKITFKLHDHSGDPTGDSDAEVKIDANVTITDIERNIDIADEPLLDDSERPTEEPETPGPGPDEPSAWDGPSVEAESPLKLPAKDEWEAIDGVVSFECAYTVSDPASAHVVLNFESKSGFEEFYAEINSPNLTPDELAGVGLASHLDLVNDEEGLWDALNGLGLPTNVGGLKSSKFDISTFMPLLAVFGAGTHEFEIHVKDASGELVVKLVLTFN